MQRGYPTFIRLAEARTLLRERCLGGGGVCGAPEQSEVVWLISCSRVSLSFLSEPVSTVQKQGGVVHLRCSLAPLSPASAWLSWRFGGVALDPATATGARLEPGRLTLPSLQPSQAGRYQCIAHSDTHSIASRYAHVSIADIAEFGESHRRTLAVEEGSTALIQCLLPHSNPPALPRLRVRGEWLEESTGEYLILPSGNLQIVSISSQHQGMYKCGAHNPVTQETRVEARGTKLTIKHLDGPSLVRIVYPVTPQTVSVVQSESVTLECVLAGSPSPAAHWTKDGEEVAAGSNHRLLHNNLVLTSVSGSDGGRYQCSAHTGTGDLVSANYTVTVLEPASVLPGLTDQLASPGSSIFFTCGAKGNPAPNVTWLFNSTSIAPSPHLQISGSSLHVTTVTQQNQGNIPVPGGQRDWISPVSWHAHCPIRSEFPASHPVTTFKWNVPGGRRRSSVLQRQRSARASHPLPQQAPARSPGDRLPPHAMPRPGSGSLYIQAVTQAHAGKYICEASNELGSDQAEAFLTVVPLESTTQAVAVEPSVQPIQSDEGEEPGHGQDTPVERTSDTPPEAPIIMSPPQTHKPNVYDLEWRAGRDWGSPINAYFVKYRKLDDVGNVAGAWHTVRVPGSEKALRLSELEASSLYEVLMVARSSAGGGQPAMLTFRTGKEKNASSSKHPSKAPFLFQPEKIPENENPNIHFGVVIPDRVPEAPDRPTVSMASESSVYVTWIPRANGGSPITAFRVEYRRQGRSAEWLVAADNISPLKLSVEVRTLQPGSMYRFRVVAVNTYGESPHSGPSRPYAVSPASPPFSSRPVAGPHISSTDAVSDTQIILRWTYTPSSNNNTPIQGFYIYYRPTDSDNDSDYKRDVVEGNKQWHLIGQLQPETSYDIKMQCFNDGGESEYSNVMICETKARQTPGVPRENPITPPGPQPPDPPAMAAGLLYLIVGGVLGVMVLILLAFITMCLWRNRQQSSLHKYDPLATCTSLLR
ncbi:hypothetical protein AAFF_G00346640 [Aldrovandia affinis]|uniref:Cell adhesion molecule-related/down-regulated by oncogenes n=1 Tax=Aldrovandia affinis TaxID=143900 RepID=A0AAD7WNP9_9TELE|nr:hypothetical protein AAFF_G00346640 [Aldrovandia affinis]